MLAVSAPPWTTKKLPPDLARAVPTNALASKKPQFPTFMFSVINV